jgi:FBP C-terminal treble-clef zinc-finger
MFRLDTEDALLAAFRPKDQKPMALPPGATFPLDVRDCLSWTHPAGGRAYLLFATPGGSPTGIAFEVGGGSGPGVPHMCDWCHFVGAGGQVGLLTAVVNGRVRAGVNVCTDLSCKKKLEDEADRLGISAAPAVKSLITRMGRFAAEALKIDLSGAGR